jgi:allose kinase
MVNKAVGVDIGGTNVRVGLVSQDGSLEKAVKISRSEAFGDDKPHMLEEFLARYISGLNETVSAVGVGIPGTLDKSCRSILNVPNIHCLNGLPYADMLSERLKLPVFFENDTVMLLNGDISRLSLESEGLILGVYIGTGLGGTLFYKGKPLKGKNGINEIGHIPLLGKKDKCTCGNIGCAENYVSGRYLNKLISEKYPGLFIGDIFTTLKGTEELKEYIDTLGIVLATAVNLIDPDLLILGGGVVSTKDFPKAEIEASVRFHAMKPQPSQGLKIIYPAESDFTGVIGGGLYALQSL